MAKDFAEKLLKWYDNTARDLLWRQDKDPYKIWVSEIMLQQTRVDTVKPYYERWINRYPDVKTLAESSEDEVMQYWQGLGYYSRARNLLRGVREVCNSYGGQVPDDKMLIQSLPGVGEYTAGAILSIAYNRAEPAVDGNVLRVYSRLYCICEEISQLSVRKRIIQLVKRQIPPDRPGDFNQALMELGATVCAPRNPLCASCPLNDLCEAFREKKQQDLPVKEKKTKVKTIFLAAAIIRIKDKYLLVRRPSKGLLAGMWEFPTAEMENGLTAETSLQVKIQGIIGAPVYIGKKMFELTHLFSHRKWKISFYEGRASAAAEAYVIDSAEEDRCNRWFALWEWDKICFAGPHRQAEKYIRLLTDSGEKIL